MDRVKYQVFVSSTYRGLEDERRQVMQALLEMDCIPSGMELFPASSDEVWQLIRSVIAEADYYVLVVGGRYGSTDTEGVSYTEREYDLTVQLGIPVLPFLHGDPGKIPAELSEMDQDGRAKLNAFREKVEGAHHCKYWTSAEGLGGIVSRALSFAIRTNPRMGWVRGDRAKTVEEVERTAKLQERVRELEDQIAHFERQNEDGASMFAQGDELIPREVLVFQDSHDASSLALTWNDVFVAVADHVVQSSDHDVVSFAVDRLVAHRYGIAQEAGGPRLQPQAMETILRQFLAANLLTLDYVSTQRSNPGGRLYSQIKRIWRLTPKGLKRFARLTAIKRAGDRPSAPAAPEAV